MSWTDERIDRLKALWAQGQTASQIAEDLGGVTRNAVIGKAHRLGLEARPSPVKNGEPLTDALAEIAVTMEPEEIPVAEPLESGPVVIEDDEPAPAIDTVAGVAAEPAKPAAPLVRSIGPGGFERQMPGEGQVPIPPAPPRRLVPAKPSADIAGKTSLLELNDRICKWPMGHPGEPDFHFCGQKVNPGFPYCLGHCSVAYQAQLPRRDRRPPPPLPYGGPRVR